ncbi:MAG: CoB--CoM heterodisulfide reductase iron-sulfur subunit A family protein [Chloroflexota bacterium]|nr:CoB--CoM heterodisulfide reductase iron-sulfur subunit A family protein [Chloroflexota bacterium]
MMACERVGVYVCHCGSNIAGTVDVGEVARFAETLPNVVVSRDYRFMCSDPGQNLIKQDIRDLGLTRVVVASCSPRLHEGTFRGACQEAGLNAFLFQMANIREHVSWVTLDKKVATEKAKALVAGAVQRVVYQTPLEARQANVKPGVLVVGGGIAGIQAALEVANAGFQVYLVERDPSIGGHMARFDKTFPTLDCAACILTPKMVAVRQNKHIKLLTYSEVVDVSGYVGNFNVKVRKKARYVNEEKCTGCGVCTEKCPWKTDSEFEMGLDKRKAIYTPFPQAVPNVPVIDKSLCIYFKRGTCKACVKFCEAGAIDFDQQDQYLDLEVGAIIVATGFQPFDPRPLIRYGYKRLPNVLTAMEFERILNASGPTDGRILTADGVEPKAVAIIHCVGSRDTHYHENCSRVCCMYSLKFAHLLKERVPGAQVFDLYTDMRSFGKGYEEFYNRVRDEGTHFIRGRVAEVTDGAGSPQEGRLIVQVEDTLIGIQRRLAVDMVVLAAALEPRADTREVARLFSLSVGKDGFFIEKHPKLDPAGTMNDGVFIVGCCQSPKDIPDTVAQASAAAARAIALMTTGFVTLEPIAAFVDEARCSGCRTCNALCPYHAIEFDVQEQVSRVNEVLCKGCGTCAAACPVGAIESRNFTTQQLLAEIEGVLSSPRNQVLST